MPDPDEPIPRRQRGPIRRRIGDVEPALLALVCEGFLSRLAFGILSFALPLYALELGLGLSEIGVLLSLNLIVAMALKPLTGWIADRAGLKLTLVAGIVLRSGVSLTLAFATVPWQLFATRSAHGVSIALRDPPINALIAEGARADRIASSFAWYQTAKSVAGSLGRVLAGLLIALTGANYSLVFGFAFVLSLLPVYVVARYVREPGPASATTEVKASPTGTGPDDSPGILRFAGVGFAISGTGHMLGSLFPVLAVEYGGLSAGQAGLVYAFSALVALSGPAFGWISDNVSRSLVLQLRGVANVASSLLYLVAPGLAGFAAGRALDDAGKAAFKPAWGALMADVSSFDRSRRARTMGYMSAGEDAGEMAGPILAGALWSSFGAPVLLVTRIALSIAAEVYTVAVTAPIQGPPPARSESRPRAADRPPRGAASPSP